MGRTDTKMVPLHDNHIEQVSFSRIVATSGICTGRYVLLPDVQPSVIVKAGALITVVITSSTCCKNQGLQVRLCCNINHFNRYPLALNRNK